MAAPPPTSNGADGVSELSGTYDLDKLPWPPAASDAPEKSSERIYAEFSDFFQSWCCNMVLALVKIRRDAPDNRDAGRLAYQILNVPRNKLTRKELLDNIVLWSSGASRIAQPLKTSASRKAIEAGKFLQRVLSAVPGLKLMLSCFGDLVWNCFTGTGAGGKRTGGASGVGGGRSGGRGGGTGDDGNGDRPPRGWFPGAGEPEDKAERMRKVEEWHADVRNAVQDLAEVLNDTLAIHHQLGQPNQGGGAQPNHAPLGQQALNLINVLLAAIQQGPLVGDVLGNLNNRRNQTQAVVGALPNDPAYAGVRQILMAMIRVLLGLQLTGTMLGLLGRKWT
ncbi:hypothetical protein B0T19DRAFT_404320 [Cercophora scortea]|uniref:Uncharacterized protein n=1 Tax=Cercophora scortea TaxID=314031 RepID=A0AAE0M6J9_9PEZI|nr:hypothetical protein B0T19DRAFT_404320 [Cercophora scortea]